MKKLFLILLLLFPLNAPALDIIEYQDAGAVLGRIKMRITVDNNNDEWVWFKLYLRMSTYSTPINYCTMGKSISPSKYGPIPDTSVLGFLLSYGPFPNTETPVMRNDPWCTQ